MPVRIISEMLGIPQELHDTFVNWSRAIAVFRGSPDRTVEQAQAAQDALIELTDFFRKTVAERKRNKGNDLISLLIDIEEEGEVLTEEELYAQCIALLFAGHETTRNLIGNGMYTLLQHPQETAELRENPEMIRTAVEEILRYESPVQFTARVLKEDIEVCGQRIPKKWSVLCMLGAANRDPKRFKDPNQLDLKRLNNQHLAFSAGPHACIGGQLARLRGTNCNSESGAALSRDEAHWPATGMGINVWSQRTKRSFGYSIDRLSSGAIAYTGSPRSQNGSCPRFRLYQR